MKLLFAVMSVDRRQENVTDAWIWGAVYACSVIALGGTCVLCG